MKTVLILTASTGQGHNAAADSLAEAFSSKGYNVVKYEFIKESNRVLNRVVVTGYELLALKMPRFYGNLYKLSDVKKINNVVVKHAFLKAKSKVLEVVREINPSIIIGTHPFSVSVISKLKERKQIDIPFISIVTDFKAHYCYIDDFVDAYITGSDYTKEDMCKKDVPQYKVFSYGIPIRKDFLFQDENCIDRDSEYFNVLIMAGSFGMNGMAKVVEQIIKNEHKLKVIVVCGNNNHLKNELINNYSHMIKNESMEVLGFTKQIPKLMQNADMIITKPGGLTVSEAIVKELPMIIPYAIPGQEVQNTEFLVEMGAAIAVNDISEINSIINNFIEKPEVLDEMKKNIRELSKNYSLDNIVRLSEKLMEKQ